ncbi:MAG: BrnT family toxin [Acidobacteriaceae bacterium]
MSARRSKDPLESCTGFNWDDANMRKNRDRHQVTPEEAEDIFFNDPLIVRSDEQKSRREKRYWALGQTSTGRKLFAAFTVRRNLIRVISVRDQTRRESEFCARYEEKNP